MFLKCAHGSESLVRRRMAAMLGTIRRWTPDEIAYLKANYGPKTATEIAVTLKRSKQSVLLKCMTLGLRLTAEQTTRARSLGRPDQRGEKNPCWKAVRSVSADRVDGQPVHVDSLAERHPSLAER